MSKASEAALAELHGAVAVALTEVVKVVDTEPEDGAPGMRVLPSAAHIMAAITFLKNNNITADASSNAELAELTTALAARRAKAKGRLTPEVLDRVATEFDRDLGGHLQ